ncbi:DUF6350 family protein [Cellulomonas sp. P22]|uniref:cell division protein PerM n=1 Tax=Cellulomonas sp. P22 TaxID=3373189 RepID=UPI0037A08AD5
MTDPSGTDRLDRARRPRVLTDEAPPTPPGSAVDGTPRWVTGLLAGVQGAVLSLLVVVLPAVTAYVVTSADPSNAGTTWTDAARVGAGLWLLGHGVPLGVGDGVVTLVPLGITCLALFTCGTSARRSGYATPVGLGAGVGGYAVLTAAIALCVRASVADVALALLGGAAVSGAGLAAGLARRSDATLLRTFRALRSRVVPPVRTGAGAGLVALSGLVAVAAAVVVAWVLTGRSEISEVVRALDLDVVGGGVLALAQLGLVPNLVVWALAWVVGAGFQVGTGSMFTPTEVVAGPLPAVPLLGALPQPGSEGGVLAAAPLLVVVAGLVAGWWLHRRLPTDRWVDPLVAGVVAALVAGVGAALLVAAASGGVGPGRMAEVGASTLAVGLRTGAGVLVGVLAVTLPGDAAFRGWCADVARRVVSRGSRDSSGSPAT